MSNVVAMNRRLDRMTYRKTAADDRETMRA
jgi:hypothetical protein